MLQFALLTHLGMPRVMAVTLDLDAALSRAMELGASDLHIKVPSRPRARVTGVLRPLEEFEPVTPADTDALAARILRSDLKRDQFERRGSVEVSYYTQNARFRASVFRQRGSVALIFRMIAEAPTPEGLRIPPVVLG